MTCTNSIGSRSSRQLPAVTILTARHYAVVSGRSHQLDILATRGNKLRDRVVSYFEIFFEVYFRRGTGTFDSLFSFLCLKIWLSSTFLTTSMTKKYLLCSLTHQPSTLGTTTSPLPHIPTSTHPLPSLPPALPVLFIRRFLIETDATPATLAHRSDASVGNYLPVTPTGITGIPDTRATGAAGAVGGPPKTAISG